MVSVISLIVCSEIKGIRNVGWSNFRTIENFLSFWIKYGISKGMANMFIETNKVANSFRGSRGEGLLSFAKENLLKPMKLKEHTYAYLCQVLCQ